MKKLLLKNCRLYDSESGILVDILIENEIIKQIGQHSDKVDGCEILDAGQRIIAPGFIDVHIQGAGGADVLDATPEALPTISKTLACLGVTSFLTTTVIKPSIQNRHIQLATDMTGKDLGGANLLGIHLEGPFINPDKRGGISSEAIHPPDQTVLDEILGITGSTLKMMTIAPELEGNAKIINKLVQRNIVASFGHSSASYEQTKNAFKNGITHVTHLFNAMPGLHHRNPGPLPAIFEAENVTVQLIVDGVHIHPAVVKMIYDSFGSKRIVAITDGIQAIGLPEGKYVYNDREYESVNGTARYNDGTLIGTAVGLNEMMLRFRKYTSCSLIEAIHTVTINPATTLGIDDRKGSIAIGKDADLLILDSDYSVCATIVSGMVVYQKNKSNL